MTIRYNIKITSDSNASERAQVYGAFDNVSVVSAVLDTLRCEVSEEDAAWFEAELDTDESVASYTA